MHRRCKLNPATYGNVGVVLRHGALNFHCAAHRIDGAHKFNQGAITRRFDEAAAILGDFGIDDFAATSLECCKSTFLVDPISRL
jgi:hypothetical protein